VLALIFLLVVSYAAAALNHWFERHSVRWYATIQKPPGIAASGYLSPAWSAAYFLAAVAAWRIWAGRGGWQGAPAALTAFFAELALSVVWAGLLFGARSIAAGFIAAVAFWLAAVASDFAFWKISKFSGTLMLIYLMWITYAAIWNARLLRLNRAD
jgi:tryptophan-rich sensory protein